MIKIPSLQKRKIPPYIGMEVINNVNQGLSEKQP